jgi:hypothetical protein
MKLFNPLLVLTFLVLTSEAKQHLDGCGEEGASKCDCTSSYQYPFPLHTNTDHSATKSKYFLRWPDAFVYTCENGKWRKTETCDGQNIHNDICKPYLLLFDLLLVVMMGIANTPYRRPARLRTWQNSRTLRFDYGAS